MPAPEGNKYAIGNSGRAKQYESPEELQADVDAYFVWCDENPIKVHHSQIDRDTSKPFQVETQRPYTIEGLAIHLKSNRQTLLNYQKREGYEEFFDIIQEAKEKITKQRIELATVGVFKEGFTKFLLVNNTDYVDKSEQKVDQSAEIQNTHIDNLTYEQLYELKYGKKPE